MGDVERVVDIDVAIGVGRKVVEDVPLKGIGRFHDKCVEIEPPEPAPVLVERQPKCTKVGTLTILLWGTSACNFELCPLSPSFPSIHVHTVSWCSYRRSQGHIPTSGRTSFYSSHYLSQLPTPSGLSIPSPRLLGWQLGLPQICFLHRGMTSFDILGS